MPQASQLTDAAPLLLLVEGDGPCSRPDALVVRWSSLHVATGECALPALVETSAPELRTEYLEWISALGRVPTRLGPLGEALKIRAAGGMSFWPLTQIAEKAPFKSKAVYETFKMRALERLYEGRGCHGVEYAGSDARVAAMLEGWCRAMGHPYRRVAVPEGKPPAEAGRRRGPAWLLGVLLLVHLMWTRWRLCARRSPARGAPADLAAVTYFPNIDIESAGSGRFRSRYWEKLHDLLDERGLRTDWLWIYAPSEQATYAQAVRLRDEFDRNSRGKDRHYLLEELLTLRRCAAVLAAFIELRVKASRVSREARLGFRLPRSAINVFPLFAAEWRASLFGAAAMQQVLYVVMLGEFARRTPGQRLLYLWENQSWEKALLAARGEAQAAPTIGCQHATLPPLDLRAFPADGSEPVPDVLIVNGAVARDEMVLNGFPPQRLLVASAVRYAHLAGFRNAQARALPDRSRTLLVIGGYLSAETLFQMDLLSRATDALGRYGKCILKLHPYSTLPASVVAPRLSIPVEVSLQPLTAHWDEADVVYCANSTSAAVEAAWLGLPLVIAGAGDGLNLSPLQGWPGLSFATDARSLSELLDAPPRIVLPSDYFCFEERLESWRRILSDAATTDFRHDRGSVTRTALTEPGASAVTYPKTPAPMLSIVMPVYNRPLELRRALASLASQTLRSFEVVVCDDGSTEDVSAVASSFSGALDVKYIRIENSGGPARPRNTAIAACKYDWISFLDSDDWWTATRVAQVVSAIQSHPGCAVFYHKLAMLGAPRHWWTPRVAGSDVGQAPFVHLMSHGNCIPNSSVVIDRAWIHRVGKIDESAELASIEDFDYWLRLAREGARFHFIDKCLGYYAPGGISADPARYVHKVQTVFDVHVSALDPDEAQAAVSRLSYELADLHLAAANRAQAYALLMQATNLRSPVRRAKRIVKMLSIRLLGAHQAGLQ